MFHTIVQLSNGSFFVFGGRESPLKPCLDYGIFTMDEDSLETNRNSPTDPVKEISNFIWKGALSMQPSETERQRNEPCPRWRHTATRVIIEGNGDLFLNNPPDAKLTINYIHQLASGRRDSKQAVGRIKI